jgi:Icc-related predicted phosphoesterase
LSRLCLPVLLVRGNSDSRQLETLLDSFPALNSLHLIRKTVNSVNFVGVGGTLPLPFHSRLGFRESSMVTRLSDLLQSGDILVTHPPPYGIRDQVLGRFHAGSRAVKRLVEQWSPALVICGHIHDGSGVTRKGQTVVINCAMNRSCTGVLIDYDGRSAPACRLLH